MDATRPFSRLACCLCAALALLGGCVKARERGDAGEAVHAPRTTVADGTKPVPSVAFLRNGGFEELDDAGVPLGWTLPDGFSPAPGLGRNGTAAIACDSRPGLDSVRPVMQNVALEGGRSYRLSFWARLEGGLGANIGLEWFDGDGHYSGTYSPNLKEAADWTLVEVVTPKLPDNLATCNVLLSASYVAKGGRAFFDDVAIDKLELPPIAGLFCDAYRGVVADGETLVLRAALNLPKETASVVLRYPAADGAERAAAPVRLSPDIAEFALDASTLAPGAQTLVCSVLLDGVAVGEAACRVERVLEPPHWRVRFDHHGRTFVDGEPFFPLGMFMGVASEEEIAAYREAPFNCVMPYAEPDAEVLDRCAAAGLKVLFSLKDVYRHKPWAQKRGIATEADEEAYVAERVEAFKNHPALLAWYLDDESGPEYADIFRKRRALFERLDPDHPTWIVLYQVHQLDAYMGAFDCIGTDPYPVARSPISLASDWTRRTRRNTFGVRPVWMVPQAFSWQWYRGGQPGDRMPTEKEMRSMAWQMVASGANGLLFYSFHNIRKDSGDDYERNWSAVKTVASELARFSAVFLLDPGPDAACAVPAAKLPVRTWRGGDAIFVLAANATPECIAATIALEGARTSCETLFGSSAAIAPDGRLALDLPPWGVALVRLAP